MALFNEIQVGRFSALLQKLCSIKGAAPSPQLAGEIIPTLPLEVDRPEWKYLAGERLCWGGGQVAAVAGEKGAIQIVNRWAGTLAVVDRIQIGGTTAGTVYYVGRRGSIMPGGSTQLASGFRDFRNPDGSDQSTLQIWSNTSAASLIETIYIRCRLNAQTLPYCLEGPWVVTPGSSLIIQDSVVNQIVTANFFWRERKIELDELLA